MTNCNLTTCRYNEKGKCTNKEKRKECVEVSVKVLCIEKSKECGERKEICKTNPQCKYPNVCGYAIETTTFEEMSNGISTYVCGREKCPYNK